MDKKTEDVIASILGFILGIIIVAGIIFFIVIGFSIIFGVIPPTPRIIDISDISGPGEGVSGLQGGYIPVNYTDIQESRIAILERIDPPEKRLNITSPNDTVTPHGVLV
jgi:hypothetical protein